MKSVVVSFIISLTLSLVVILLTKKFKIAVDRYPKKHNINPKKSTPRLGGLAILVSMLVSYNLLESEVYHPWFFSAIILIYLIGFLEDITSKLSAKSRFNLLIFLTAMILLSAGDDLIVKKIGFDMPFYLSFLFSTIAFAGLTNAFNLIDGINGLASGLGIIIIIIISILSLQNNLLTIFNLTLYLTGSILGFFMINFSTGKIFLGDGGAYLIGFSISLLCGYLANHLHISPYFFAVLLIYPVYDTLFAIYRRSFLRNQPPFSADLLHLHSLLARRIFKSHRLTTLNILCVNLSFFIIAWLIKQNTPLLILLVIIFVIIYNTSYFAIIKKLRKT